MRDSLWREANPELTPAQDRALRAAGERRRVAAGDVLFRAEDPEYPLIYVLSGELEVRDPDGVVLGVMEPGQFAGELSLLLGQTTFATCTALIEGEVQVIPRADVLEMIHADPDVSDLLIGAFAARRSQLMQRRQTTLTIVGRDGSPGLRRLLEYADRTRVPHRWLNPDDPEDAGEIRECGAAGTGVHVVVRGRHLLTDPSVSEVARALGLDLAVGHCEPLDLIIVGAGPAGLAAAVYGASEGLQTAVIDDTAIGGQAGTSSRIENYLGFPQGLSGGDLAFRAELQAVKFGARVGVPRRAVGLRSSAMPGFHEVDLDDGTILLGRAVVLATGARYRKLGLEEEERFEGLGLYYAATELEARTCRDREVVVVGGGNSAGQAAMFLSRRAACVRLVCRGDDLGRTMSRYLIDRLEAAGNVDIRLRSRVTALRGERRLEAATIGGLGGESEHPCCGLFAMIGAAPCTEWLAGAVALDEKGFVLTGGEGAFSPYETSRPGVFAVGDVRAASVKRVASAVGEGSVVVQAVHARLTEAAQAVR